jgi:hypothetical protein
LIWVIKRGPENGSYPGISGPYEADGVIGSTVSWKTSAGVYSYAEKITASTITTATIRRTALQEQENAANQKEVYRFIADSGDYTTPDYTVTIDYTGVTWN